MSGSVSTTLVGRVSFRGDGQSGRDSVAGPSDYHVTVSIPRGADPALVKGNTVRVTLPILHHRETQASVETLERGRLELLLPKQVQELSGQEVRIEIPLKAAGIYRVPFTSIYSPRGATKQLFVLQGDHVETRDIEVVAMANASEILVAGRLSPGEQIVVQGMDNLLSGDAVRVLTSEEQR